MYKNVHKLCNKLIIFLFLIYILYTFSCIFFNCFSTISIAFYPSDAILPIVYTYVRKEDLFLKGYRNDCTVSSLLLYIILWWLINVPKPVTVEVCIVYDRIQNKYIYWPEHNVNVSPKGYKFLINP